MPLARTALTLAAVLALGACDSPTEAPASAPAPAAEPDAASGGQEAAEAAQGGLALEGEGLRAFTAQGSARALPFGLSQEMVLTAVSTLLDAPTPEVTTNSECGAGPTQFAEYPNGLQLAFQNGEFAGWYLDEAGLTTADGVGVGTSRADLQSARAVEMIPDSTLGTEFSSGDLGGFLSSDAPDATVESLYAGLTCFFR
jgi:hypothetical protein